MGYMIDRYAKTRELRSGPGDLPERVEREYEYLDAKKKIRKIGAIGSLRNIDIPPARCCDCRYWTKERLLICAVNIPRPTLYWSAGSDLAESRHNCPDFDPIAR